MLQPHPGEFGHVGICLAALRIRVGRLPFLQIVAFTPMTFMPMSARCVELVGEQIRENVALSEARHFLECFLDRLRGTATKVSLAKLAGCIYHVERDSHLTPNLDADAVFALLAMRRFDVTEIERPDSNFQMTPLHAATSIHASCPEILHLLLHLRADAGGYHFQRFDEDGFVFERETLLARAVRVNRPAAVEAILKARVDPNEICYEKNLQEDTDHADTPELQEISPFENHISHHCARTPLWTAVDRACYVERHGEPNVREVVKMLLRYRARPDECGNVECHRLLDGAAGCREIHMNDSDTTAEEIVRRACEEVPRDLLDLLRSCRSCRGARKRPREVESPDSHDGRSQCADQA